MSYILEALATSEQARQQIAAAPKYSLLPVVGEEMPRQRRWPYALAGALLVNAAVLQVWLRPGHPGEATSIKAPAVLRAAQEPAAALEQVIELADVTPARTDKSGADSPQRTPRKANAPKSQREPVGDRRVALAPAPADAERRSAPTRAASDDVPVRVRAPKSAPKAVAKREVEPAVVAEAIPSPAPSTPAPAPAAVAAEAAPGLPEGMPVLSVAGFIRDSGSGSMVIVNDRLVREGDEVAPGVRLAKILDDGLEFDYNGFRFKR